MKKNLIKTSMTASVCLSIITVLAGIFQNELSINVLINIFSYFGVYGIALYLSKNNSNEKIILTLINLLTVFILVSFSVMAIQKYHGLQIIVLIMFSIIGTICALWSIWINNKFNKQN